jgi:cellulose synthase/poly-beta-1,6-N-acetylglucosamine synthase-like glycosyltransferase
MLLTLGVVLGAVYAVCVLGLLVYGMNAYLMVALQRRGLRRPRPIVPPPTVWPTVTVQLPIFNERYVARRLLEAVGALDYPESRLEIQVLDDSTDETAEILVNAVRLLTARGLSVVYLHRSQRAGFKAGALAAGLKEASGEFVAIFDADFVPPPDFLRRTLPHFHDPRVAVVQARWGHLNQDFSWLTVAQALGIDGHFVVEQSARCRGGLFLNFNGTAGVWRRIAIDDAGGWTHDTLTEDLDLSYRAQLRGWRIEYRDEIVCPAELPVLVTGLKSQQRRWARGSMQTAVKLLPAVWRSPRSGWVKCQAAIHLTYYAIHPLMLLVVLLSAPLLLARPLTFAPTSLTSASLIVGLAAAGPGCMLVYAQSVLGAGWLARAWRLPAIMVIGVGLAWSTSLAALGGLRRRHREAAFVRTPKFGIGPTGGEWRDKGYAERRPSGALAELALGGYCAATAWLHGHYGEYAVIPFLLLYACGFLAVGGLTLLHTGWGRPRRA